MKLQYHHPSGPWWSFWNLDLFQLSAALTHVLGPVVMTERERERERESDWWCLAEREVQDKLRPLLTPGHVPPLYRAVVVGTAQFTTQPQPTTVPSDQCFSQINSSGRAGLRLAQSKIISLQKCQTKTVHVHGRGVRCSDIFPLVTSPQFSSQIIISGRYRRYLQTWHLPPPQIIFSCNKSGFPAPGPARPEYWRRFCHCRVHNYHHLAGQTAVINQCARAISASYLGLRVSSNNFNISNVYCKTSDGRDHPRKSILEFCHFYSFSVYLHTVRVDHGKIFNTEMWDRKREERILKELMHHGSIAFLLFCQVEWFPNSGHQVSCCGIRCWQQTRQN